MKRALAVAMLVAILPASASRAQAATIISKFKAVLKSSNVIKDGGPASTAPSTGVALLTLEQPMGDPSATTIAYRIMLDGLDLDGSVTPGVTSDNVTAIHIHNLNLLADLSPNGLGDTAATQHVLNIFGIPRGGDDLDDMAFNASIGIVTGLWENTDATPIPDPTNPPAAPTFEVTSVLDELFAGELFVMLHTTAFPGGAIGGTIHAVPEPSSMLLGLFALTGVLFGRCICSPVP